MIINFNNVNIEGFQSIGKASVDLKNQGIVFVKGINEYEEYTDSNGSGKSSIFESIFWCLYGKTTKGIIKPVNRFYENGCCVELNFSVDEDSYKLIRAVNHKEHSNKVMLIQNSVDISARNKSDTDKLIQNNVLNKLSPDLFLSIIFLSQGFNNRISSLSPSSRKERLEYLSGISGNIQNLKDVLSEIEVMETLKYNDISKEFYENSGKLLGFKSEKEELNSLISEADGCDLSGINEEDINNEISKLKNDIDEMDKHINEYENKISVLRNKRYDKNSIKSTVLRKIKDTRQNILDIRSNNYCPTCKRVINDPKVSDSLIKKFSEEMNNLKLQLMEIESSLSKIDKSVSDIHDKQLNIIDDKNLSKNKLSEDNNKLIEYYKNLDKDKNIKRLKRIKSEIEELESKISELEKSKNDSNSFIGTISHCGSMISKNFRNYLLNDAIEFMNNRLRIYSEMLYSNEEDVIYLKSESSKINIYLNDSLFDSLSGGEGRKIDIALSMAQRDLALHVSGFSSNVFIMDEVMDYLDDKSISSVSSVISSVSENVDSMFIISHKQPSDIPYDSVLTVVKNKNQISEILGS